MRHRTNWIVGLAAVASLLLVACDTEQAAVPRRELGEPRHGGQLTIAVRADAQSLDPHSVFDAGSMRMIENLYSTLMRYTPEYPEVEGDLAEAWEISDDNLAYTFRLRPGAQFHSGRPVTAEDVRYSIERIIEQGARATHFDALDRIEVAGEHELVIHLREPSAALLSNLAYPMNAIVDRAAVEDDGVNLENTAAGSGPFRMIEWRRDQHMIMQRHEQYHREGLPYLEQVTYRPIPDETGRSTALRNREVDIVLDVAAKDIALVEGRRGVVVDSVPGTFWEYLGLNTRQAPLDQPEVRQAIAWTIDRDALVRIKEGHAQPLKGGLIPPHHWAHGGEEIYPEPDLDRARELLRSAGHADGFELTISVNTNEADQRDAAMAIQQQLAQIGIRARTSAQEPGIFFTSLSRGEFEATVVGWVGFVDPDEWTYNIFHSEGPYNQQGYSNPRVDELLERGRATLDRDERRQIYAEAQRLIAADAPMVFLYINDQTSAYLDDVGGFVVHPTGTTRWLAETWVQR